MKKIVLILMGFLMGINLWAQNNPVNAVTVQGRAVSNTGKPIEYANILLLRAKDSTLVKGNISDTTGKFELPGITSGQYILSISSMGFAKYYSKVTNISNESLSFDFGLVTVIENTNQLEEVIVKGERPAIERQVDKILVNPSNSIFKASGNALDILGRSPGVLVDAKGGVLLKGVTPLIIIDGKNQPISVEELRALSPDAIEQIELIGNAGVKYEGETRAVINIKLKRDKNLGLRGDSYLSYGQNKRYGSYSLGLNMTYKTRKWTYFGNYSYSDDNDYLDLSNLRKVYEANAETVFDENNSTKFGSNGHFIRIGGDFSLNKNHTLGIMAKGNFRNGIQNSYDQTRIGPGQNEGSTLSQQLQTINLSNSDAKNTALNLNYRGTIGKKGTTVSADFDISGFDVKRDQHIRNNYFNSNNEEIGLVSQLRNNSPSTTDLKSFKVDFAHPVNKSAKVELGARTSWNTSDNNLMFDTLAVNDWIPDKGRSNHFIYKEQIFGAYVNLSKEIGKNSISAGMRIENTNTQGNSLTLNNVVDRNYFRWLPNIQFMHKITDNTSLTAGYSRKITRPSYFDLNPFKFYLNPYSYTEGNPFLLPITSDVADVSYAFNGFSFGITYKHDTDVFAQMPVQNDETKVLYYTRVNLDSKKSLSFDLYAPVKITDWWNIQHSLSYYYQQLKSVYLSNSFNNTQWSFYLYGNQVFTMSKTMTVELNYYYSSPTISQIYNVSSFGAVGINVKKSIWNRKADLILNLTDLFSTYREKFATQYQNIDIAAFQLRGTRTIGLRFSYRFGSSTFNRRYRGAGNSEEENRVKMN